MGRELIMTAPGGCRAMLHGTLAARPHPPTRSPDFAGEGELNHAAYFAIDSRGSHPALEDVCSDEIREEHRHGMEEQVREQSPKR